MALGSNLGARERFLELARQELERGGFRWTLASPIHETAPVGGPAGQRHYLNQLLAAPRAAVALDAESLLELALEIERRAGRERRERWGPRTLDIDLLLFGAERISKPGLELPHPRMHQREFVLAPLCEILPQLEHPVFGVTIEALLARLSAR